MVVLVALLCILAGCVLGIVSLILRVIKRSKPKLKVVALVLLLAGLELLVMTSGSPVGQVVMLNALLLFFLGIVSGIYWIILRLMKKNRRFMKVVVPGLFMAGILCMIVSGKLEDRRYMQAKSGGEIHTVEETQKTCDFEIKDGDTPLEISLYTEFGHTTSVYDSTYLSLFFDEDAVTAEQCRAEIDRNPDIPDRFKAYFKDFVDRIERTWPDTDFRILYHNLQTLKVEELGRSEFMIKSMDPYSCGVYRLDENAIYIPENTEYIEGEWGYQVLIHEFCHAARSYRRKGEEKRSNASFQHVADEILNEAMNSVFSCSLLSYEEKDIAYQVPGNYLRIMLECMDNYTIGEYMQKDDAWFLKKLDEYTGHTNYASVIWKLISLQRNDWYEEDIDIPAETYDPIYDYLCELYYPLHITAEMTEEEKQAVADELVEKAFYDAPEDYKVRSDRFYEKLKQYTGTEDEEKNAA